MSVSSSDDIIDTRDAQQAINELFPYTVERYGLYDEGFASLSDAQDYITGMQAGQAAPGDTTDTYYVPFADMAEVSEPAQWEIVTDDDGVQELTQLLGLRQQFTDSEWADGVTLIRDTHFEDYARQLADDLGLLKNDAWPCTCIDWGLAADELQADYDYVFYDGTTYFYRS